MAAPARRARGCPALGTAGSNQAQGTAEPPSHWGDLGESPSKEGQNAARKKCEEQPCEHQVEREEVLQASWEEEEKGEGSLSFLFVSHHPTLFLLGNKLN